MIAKTMTPEQALEWLEDLRNTPGDQVLADIEDGKAAKAAQVFRALLEERDALLDALRQITAWPDGGNRYGQENIKRFARDVIIDTTLTKEQKE